MPNFVVSDGEDFTIEFVSRNFGAPRSTIIKVDGRTGALTINGQLATTGQTSGFTAGAGAAVLVDSTFTGGLGTKAYTVGDVIRALKTLGALATS